jgi:hypothetical protein
MIDKKNIEIIFKDEYYDLKFSWENVYNTKKYRGVLIIIGDKDRIILKTRPVFDSWIKPGFYLTELEKRIKALSKNDLKLSIQELSAKIFDEKFRDLCDS